MSKRRLTEQQKRGLAFYTAVQGKKMVRTILAQGVRKSEIARRLGVAPSQVTGALKSIREGRATLRTLAAYGLAVGIHWEIRLNPIEGRKPLPFTAVTLYKKGEKS